MVLGGAVRVDAGGSGIELSFKRVGSEAVGHSNSFAGCVWQVGTATVVQRARGGTGDAGRQCGG